MKSLKDDTLNPGAHCVLTLGGRTADVLRGTDSGHVPWVYTRWYSTVCHVLLAKLSTLPGLVFHLVWTGSHGEVWQRRSYCKGKTLSTVKWHDCLIRWTVIFLLCFVFLLLYFLIFAHMRSQASFWAYVKYLYLLTYLLTYLLAYHNSL